MPIAVQPQQLNCFELLTIAKCLSRHFTSKAMLFCNNTLFYMLRLVKELFGRTISGWQKGHNRFGKYHRQSNPVFISPMNEIRNRNCGFQVSLWDRTAYQFCFTLLTHRGRVTHWQTPPSLFQIMACRLFGAKPIRCQAIIGVNVEWIVDWSVGALHWNLKQITAIFIREN